MEGFNFIRVSQHVLAVFSLTILVSGAYGQMPADASAASSLEKGCTTGHDSAQVKQECLKVAKKMEHGGVSGADSANASHADSGNPPTPNTVMHSSPVMDTPEQISAAKKTRKVTKVQSTETEAKKAHESGKVSPKAIPTPDNSQPKQTSDK